ncbi:MAG: hypothetical protein RID62_14335 [Roseovarius sp.]|jgi:hypothetical protein
MTETEIKMKIAEWVSRSGLPAADMKAAAEQLYRFVTHQSS